MNARLIEVDETPMERIVNKFKILGLLSNNQCPYSLKSSSSCAPSCPIVRPSANHSQQDFLNDKANPVCEENDQSYCAEERKMMQKEVVLS